MNKRLFATSLFSLVLGVILGSFLHQPTKVRAAGMRFVQVQEVKLNAPLNREILKADSFSGNAQITGFSCVDENGTPRCFLATVQ